MQIEHRIGQLLLIGIPGTQIDGVTREILEMIQPGGVLLAGRNIESAQQVVELTSALRSILNVPPLIAVDQEGGRVDRLKSIYSPMPSADLLRASGDASIAARMGEITAEALRTLGFNVNFAPVLDIAWNDGADNGIKGRYLGASVAEVVRLAGAYLEGLQRGGVLGVGKHFPGLGASTVDSHSALPQIDRSRDELIRHDVAPYLELFSKINARLNAVITGHAHYTAIDGPAALPASISKNVITGLLRDELGFKGLTITDDLEMGASHLDARSDRSRGRRNRGGQRYGDGRGLARKRKRGVAGDGRGRARGPHHSHSHKPRVRPHSAHQIYGLAPARADGDSRVAAARARGGTQPRAPAFEIAGSVICDLKSQIAARDSASSARQIQSNDRPPLDHCTSVDLAIDSGGDERVQTRRRARDARRGD